MQLQIEQYGLTWTVKPKDLDGTDMLGNGAHGSYIHVVPICISAITRKLDNKLDKEYQDSAKQIMEVLWHEIAEARTNNEPIRLVTEYEVTPVLYLETNNKYNLALPTILEKKRTYLTQDGIILYDESTAHLDI